MAKTINENEVTIPITYAFEKRLAELVWENCPEIARQTVAGKIAMSVEIDDQVVYTIMQHEVQVVVAACVKEQAAALKEQVKSQIDKCLKDEATKAVPSCVKRVIDGANIANEVGKMIRSAVNDEVCVVVNSWLSGNNKEVMTKLIESRVDNYLYDCLKGAETLVTKAVQKVGASTPKEVVS